jgi:dienelactone hydrolase
VNVNRLRVLAVALGTLAVVATACVMPPPPATGTDPNTAPRAGEAAYVAPGPHPVGVTTLSLGDRSVEVWYPADPAGIGSTPAESYFIRDFIPPGFDALIPPEVNPPYLTAAHRDVPAAGDGPFPLSLFSHGAASFRLQSTELTTHLASWGFVVASPDYLERGLGSVLGAPPTSPRSDTAVATLAIDAVRAASADGSSVLSGTVDPSGVYPFGHSAGGGTSIRLLDRPDVVNAIPLASGVLPLNLLNGTTVLPPGKAITWIAGRQDGIAAIDGVRVGYDYTPGEKRIVELSGAGHNNAFTDICEIGEGGVAQLALATGLPIPPSLLALGDDGCAVPPFRDSPELWDEVQHFLTAEMRYRSGLDAEPVGLGDAVLASFDDVARYDHAP